MDNFILYILPVFTMILTVEVSNATQNHMFRLR